MKIRIATATAVAAALAFAVGAAMPANAQSTSSSDGAGTGSAAASAEPRGSDPVAQASNVDRVINKLDQVYVSPLNANESLGAASRSAAAGSSSATSGIIVGPSVPVPSDEQPNPGETVLVEYANANVVHVNVAATCTLTTSAGTPHLVTSGGRRVEAEASYAQSSGCSGIRYASGDLNRRISLMWRSVDELVVSNPSAGGTYWFELTYSCGNSTSSPYTSSVADSYSNEVGDSLINQSSQVSLACGG